MLRACRGEARCSLSLSLPLYLSLSSRGTEIDEESYHGGNERQRGERKIRSQAHGYTALLVNTMLRKHHGVVQRGHDVSILSSPRGPPWRVHEEHALSLSLSLSFLVSSPASGTFFLSSLAPLSLSGALLARSSRSPLRKSVQDVRERGTTHRASQITPLSESPDLLASAIHRATPPPLSFSERDSLPSVLYSYILRCVSAASSLSTHALARGSHRFSASVSSSFGPFVPFV